VGAILIGYRTGHHYVDHLLYSIRVLWQRFGFGACAAQRPFAFIGGIKALLMGVNFSTSAGVGLITLFGVAIQDCAILVNKFC
jgi:Cu/Ag efflux pump CusA